MVSFHGSGCWANSTWLSIDLNALLERLKVRIIPFASLMNRPAFRVSYGVINKYKRERFKDVFDKIMGGLVFELVPVV